MKTIEEFCHIHHACPEGRAWALANCSTMQEAWEKAPDPLWVIWTATRRGVLTDRELRLFAVWCARQVQHLLTDPRSINAIDVAERYANGEATEEELAAASAAAWAAARAAYRAAASAAYRAAYRAAASAAARAAAYAAANAEARAAFWAAAYAAARAAKWAPSDTVFWAADRDEARTAQAQWLRENTKPNFN